MKFSVVIPAGPNTEVEVLEDLKNQSIKPTQIIVIRGLNTSGNRNRGAAKSNGDLIGFVNTHSKVPEDWIENAENFFKKYPKVDVVGGPQLTPKENSFFGKVSGYALGSVFGAANVAGRYKKGKFSLDADEKDITSSNLICRKKVFEKVKFDERVYPGEDPKFIEDCKKEGFSVAYSPSIIGYNKRREKPKDLIKQMFKYGRVRPAIESFFTTVGKPVFLIPSLFVLYLALLGVFLVANPIFDFITRIGLFLVPLGVYLLLDILFSFVISIKHKEFISFFVLLIIYPIIHISYGAGMITGYFKKPKDRRLV